MSAMFFIVFIKDVSPAGNDVMYFGPIARIDVVVIELLMLINLHNKNVFYLIFHVKYQKPWSKIQRQTDSDLKIIYSYIIQAKQLIYNTRQLHNTRGQCAEEAVRRLWILFPVRPITSLSYQALTTYFSQLVVPTTQVRPKLHCRSRSHYGLAVVTVVSYIAFVFSLLTGPNTNGSD